MEVKKCVVILLLWLAATQRGHSLESARVGQFIKRNGELYSLFVAHFKNTSEVGWAVCGQFAHTKEADHYVCSKFADITNVCASHYLVYATHYTNTIEDGWNLRILDDDFRTTNVQGQFICKKLEQAPHNSEDDYFVFVKYLSKANRIGWFVCQRLKRRNYQCGGNDYCPRPN